jgi:glycosyltransferase involved in cell wall biosynthesis
MTSERLRIAQVAPIARPVTPQSGESIEQLVSLLTEELLRRGHDVTLFATGDSLTSAALHAVYPRGHRDDADLWDDTFHETMHMASAFERARDFDVIHSHSYHFALPFTRLVATPVVHTYHVLPDDHVLRSYARYPESHIVAISAYQRACFAANPDVTVVHHGIDTAAFPFGPTRGTYLLFLGRMLSGKGPVRAIRLAEQVGMRLILAGPQQGPYFRTRVAPLIDGRQVEYVGPVGAQERNTLLAGAAALVYPIVAPEPFGLVMVEAMACGTPVAAIGRGAVPEIVEPGTTGYYTRHPGALAGCVEAALTLDRVRVRQQALARFDYRRMVDDYLAVYRRLAAARRQEAETA